MIDRVLGVFKLDADTFEQIEHDQSATTQAALVVLIVAAAGFIGSLFTGGNFLMALLSGLINAFVGWLLWSVVTYFIGTSFFGGQADLGEMLRVVGFAYAPGILGIIPCVGPLIGMVWTLVAMVVAIRQGLDVDTGKAVIIGGLGFVVVVVLYAVVAVVLGTGTALVGGLFGG